MNEFKKFVQYLEDDLHKSLLNYYRDVSQNRSILKLDTDFGISLKSSQILSHAFKLLGGKSSFINIKKISLNLLKSSAVNQKRARLILVHDLYVIKKIQIRSKTTK